MAKQKQPAVPPPDPFAALYPQVARWVEDGWIELGVDDSNSSFIRVLDVGGLVWEGAASYPTVHEAMIAADAALAEWFAEND